MGVGSSPDQTGDIGQTQTQILGTARHCPLVVAGVDLPVHDGPLRIPGQKDDAGTDRLRAGCVGIPL